MINDGLTMLLHLFCGPACHVCFGHDVIVTEALESVMDSTCEAGREMNYRYLTFMCV